MNYLPADCLGRLFQALIPCGELHGPVLTDDGVVAFRKVESPSDLMLDYSRTLLPPKKYLLPPRENLLAYSPETGYSPDPAPEKNLVLFGLHSCDLKGIAYLDQVFMGETKDPFYCGRREKVTLVGLSCQPDQFCFCPDPSGQELPECDLFLRKAGAGFQVSCSTPAGHAIFDRISPYLEQERAIRKTPTESPITGRIREVSSRGETFSDSPLWDDFAARCLSCGACSCSCPTCYCHDLREYPGLDGKTAKRIREWDNCLYRAHGEIAGGFNFRKNRRERFIYRYRHKFLGIGPMRGAIACVGCGRCRQACPAGIDLTELFTC